MTVNNALAAQIEIEEKVLASLPTGISATQVKWANTACDQSGVAWMRCTINPLLTRNVVATGCRQRTTGVLTLDIFYKKDKGSRLATGQAVELQQAFTNMNTESVNFYAVDITPRGEDGERYHVQVDINYAHEGETR